MSNKTSKNKFMKIIIALVLILSTSSVVVAQSLNKTGNIETSTGSGAVVRATSPTITGELKVNGAAINASSSNVSSSTIDFAASNIAITSTDASAITVTNLKDGGAYTLIMSNTTLSTAVTFTSASMTFKLMGTFARQLGKETIYNFIVAGTRVYVSMASEN